MKRRQLLSALVGSGIAAVGGAIGHFRPGLIIGGPRGRGEPVSITHSIEEYPVTYFPTNDTVRIGGIETNEGLMGEPSWYSFEEFAKINCDDVVGPPIINAIQHRLNGQVEGFNTHVRDTYLGETIFIGDLQPIDSSTNSSSADEITREDIVSRTPRTLRATLRAGERTHTCTFPVFLKDG